MANRVSLENQELLGKWICAKTNADYIEQEEQYIGLLDDDNNIVAVTAFSDYNGASIRMHVAIEGKLTREYIRFCYYYPFEQLKVNKVIGLVNSNNKEALRFDLHSGWVIEAIIKDAAPDGDMYILSMTKEQCRFLRTKFK